MTTSPQILLALHLPASCSVFPKCPPNAMLDLLSLMRIQDHRLREVVPLPMWPSSGHCLWNNTYILAGGLSGAHLCCLGVELVLAKWQMLVFCPGPSYAQSCLTQGEVPALYSECVCMCVHMHAFECTHMCVHACARARSHSCVLTKQTCSDPRTLKILVNVLVQLLHQETL